MHPAVCWVLFILSNILWHLPAFYELALRSPAWHKVEHFCFLATALLFWWHVVQPWPSRPYWPRWAMIPYLLLADLQNTALAAFLSFYDRVLYPTYPNAPRFGIDPLMIRPRRARLCGCPGRSHLSSLRRSSPCSFYLRSWCGPRRAPKPKAPKRQRQDRREGRAFRPPEGPVSRRDDPLPIFSPSAPDRFALLPPPSSWTVCSARRSAR